MTGLTLKRLEAFICVAECGSFSEAAERMYLSQPAVSGAIAALETTLGVTLLERGRRKRILLTPQGQETYRRSKEILRSCQRLEEAFTSEETELTIGASTMPMEVLLPPLLAAFHRKHPQCRFVLRSGNSAEIHAMLQNGDVQLGLVGSLPEAGALDSRPLCSDELVLVTPNTPALREAARNGLTGSELPEQPLILRTEGSGTLRAARAFLHEAGKTPPIVAQIESNEAILRAVQQELGSAILSGSVAAPWARDGRVLSFPLRRPPVMRRLYLVLPPAAAGLSERFASFAEQYAAAHFAP